uniref:Trehalase n=1 Tax=Romanomermis culicivorax TaxID=13658 RepID=A0A915KPA2_ROMCU
MGAFNSTKGIPTSFINSEQQWDAANSWPPMVHMIIEGFRTSKNTFLQTFAQKLAAQWLRANYKVFVETNAMYEKYDCSSGSTSAGSGGEYEVQIFCVADQMTEIRFECCSTVSSTGFGWTNGVVLDLLKTYGEVIISEEEQLHQQQQQESAQRGATSLDDLSAAPKKLASVVYELIESVVAHPVNESENQPEFPSFMDNEEDEIIIDVDAETPEPPLAVAPLPLFKRSSDEF